MRLSDSREGAIFALLQYADAPKGPKSVTASDYHTFLFQNFGSSAAALIEQQYPVSAFNSTPYPAFFAISTVIGYTNYVCPAHRGLNTAASEGKVPVWTYNFAHTPNCPWLPSLPENALALIGPTHTAEIPFVFGHTTHLPSDSSNCSMTVEERALSRFLMESWTRMAVDGTPSDDWPPYKNARQSLGINIGPVNDSSAVPIAGYVDYTACAFWDEVNDMLVNQAKNESSSGSQSATNNAASTISGAGTIVGEIMLSAFAALSLV